jgi:hypothetical protein
MKIKNISPMTKDQEIVLINIILSNLLRGELNYFLKSNNIKNRTKIYKDYGYIYASNIEETQATKTRRLKHAEFILESKNVYDILEYYFEYHRVERLEWLIKNIGFELNISLDLSNTKKENIIQEEKNIEEFLIIKE